MKRLSLVCVFILGCSGGGNEAVLSIRPMESFVPVEGASELSYPAANTIQVGGLVGNWKLLLENSSDHDLTGVTLIVVANDPSKFDQSVLPFARIYTELFFGGNVFVNEGPPVLPSGEPINPGARHDGRYTVIQVMDLPARSKIAFDSVVFGENGLTLSFEAYATIGDYYAFSYGGNETTVEYSY